MLTTVSDRKIGVYSGGSLTLPNDTVVSVVDYYEPHMVNATDYYAFGMPSRVASSATGAGYRFGFNGKENDNEVKGFGNQQDYGMRIYDARVGRFLSVDPLTKGYPELTPYQFGSNRPIDGVDQDGLEWQGYLTRLGIWAAGKIDDKAEAVRNKPIKTTSDKTILFLNGVSRSTLFGASYQLAKTIDSYSKMNPEQSKQASEANKKQGIAILTSMFVDVLRGRPAGTTAVATALAPTVDKALHGDYEAMGELTGIFAQTFTPKLFNSPKSAAITQLSKLEQNILHESNSVLNSEQFQLIRNAYEKGIAVEVQINRGKVVYDPSWTYSEAMTLHNEGFLLGPKAFTGNVQLVTCVNNIFVKNWL